MWRLDVKKCFLLLIIAFGIAEQIKHLKPFVFFMVPTIKTKKNTFDSRYIEKTMLAFFDFPYEYFHSELVLFIVDKKNIWNNFMG